MDNARAFADRHWPTPLLRTCELNKEAANKGALSYRTTMGINCSGQ
jgi:hypothetical protein